jgi:hypothetical protein
VLKYICVYVEKVYHVVSLLLYKAAAGILLSLQRFRPILIHGRDVASGRPSLHGYPCADPSPSPTLKSVPMPIENGLSGREFVSWRVVKLRFSYHVLSVYPI